MTTGHPAPVVPARITLALDAAGLWGPDVDLACGAREPDVDHWEAGITTPTPEQVRLLADLTGMTPAYFYLPLTPDQGPIDGWICQRSGRGRGCHPIGRNDPDRTPATLW